MLPLSAQNHPTVILHKLQTKARQKRALPCGYGYILASEHFYFFPQNQLMLKLTQPMTFSLQLFFPLNKGVLQLTPGRFVSALYESFFTNFQVFLSGSFQSLYGS